MRGTNFGQLLRRLLEPAAQAMGVDYDAHTLFIYRDLPEMPGGRVEDVAFGMLAAGGTLLAAKTHADEFPARGRTARKGAKLLVQLLGEPQSIEASLVLSRAQALLAAERQRRAGNEDDAVLHLAAGELLQAVVPIGEEEIDALDHYLSQSFARVPPDDEAPDHAAPGAIAASNFAQWATIVALTTVLGRGFMEGKALDHLVLPGTGEDSLVAGYADQASRWLSAEERRMLYVDEALVRGWLSPD